MDVVKKECIAMILAGGKGARLGALTDHSAKPAIHFGGVYRIIDFTLSNCAHSGIDTVGILTQYCFEELHNYISGSRTWVLAKDESDGLCMLPSSDTGSPYSGTADAIYKNIKYIERFNPEHVLILSGDHIYKMDYRKMLKFHKKSNADVTISVISVPWEDASRFGILNAGEDGRITEFTEKPNEPKSNKASMGIYIFKWEKLKQYLIDDKNNSESDNDFGKNIIPAALAAGEKLYAYQFDGYWRDVGTVLSLWEANNELLSKAPNIDIMDKYWQVFIKNPANLTYISNHLNIKNSLISDNCDLYGRVENSIICENVTVAEGAIVADSILLPGAVIGRNSKIFKTFIGHNAIIAENASIGVDSGITMYHDDKICSNGISLICPGVYIEENMKIAKNSHILIWNDSYKLGNDRIDKQHMQIFELARELVASCMTCIDGSNADRTQKTLAFLSDYAINHFRDEENLQIQYSYPEFREHKQQHEDFKLTISVLAHKYAERGSSEKLANNITGIVVRWLVEHIQREDKKIGKYLHSLN